MRSNVGRDVRIPAMGLRVRRLRLPLGLLLPERGVVAVGLAGLVAHAVSARRVRGERLDGLQQEGAEGDGEGRDDALCVHDGS